MYKPWSGERKCEVSCLENNMDLGFTQLRVYGISGVFQGKERKFIEP